MKEAPYHCPICDCVLTMEGIEQVNTKDKGEYRMLLHRCVKNHYSCITRPKINLFSEMFRIDSISIVIHYQDGEYEDHAIRFYVNDKTTCKTEVKLSRENFLSIFSRDDLHPLLQKLEKYEVFQ